MGQIKFSPNEKAELLVVLPNDQLGIVKANQIKQLGKRQTDILEIEEVHSVATLDERDTLIEQL